MAAATNGRILLTIKKQWGKKDTAGAYDARN
jgi:hypothetical protein